MSIQECHLCLEPIKKGSPIYFLEHDDNPICGTVHIFDEACVYKIDKSGSCPYCRSTSFKISSQKDKSFFERYRTNEMGMMALSPAIMLGLQKVSSATFGYAFGNSIGGFTAAAFGGCIAFLASVGAIVKEPFGSSSRECLVNGISILAGLAITHITIGYNDDWGPQVGAALLLASGVANVIFARLKQSAN